MKNVEGGSTVAHDAAGNLVRMPVFDADGQASGGGGYRTLTYDAWNRLVKVETDDATPLTVATHAHDGLGRRIERSVYDAGGTPAMVYRYHHAPGAHRVIEERNGASGGGAVIKLHTPGLTYLDETCRILVNGDPVLDPGFSASDPDHTPVDYYVVQDAHYNVTAIHDDQGDLIERYAYDPYGRRRVYVPQDALDTAGTVPVDRATRVSIGSPGVDQPYAINDFGHQGLTHDEEVGLIENRARVRSRGRRASPPAPRNAPRAPPAAWAPPDRPAGRSPPASTSPRDTRKSP